MTRFPTAPGAPFALLLAAAALLSVAALHGLDWQASPALALVPPSSRLLIPPDLDRGTATRSEDPAGPPTGTPAGFLPLRL